MELENAKYEKEEILDMEIEGGYTKIPESISYVINPNEEELTELVKHTETFQKASEDVKQSMLNDVKALYTGDEPNFELDAQYAVTAVGCKNSLEVYVGGEKVDGGYDEKSLFAQHQKEWKKNTKDKAKDDIER